MERDQAGDHREGINEGLAVLPEFERKLTSVRTLKELRPVREAAEARAAEEFCARYDAAARALSAA